MPDQFIVQNRDIFGKWNGCQYTKTRTGFFTGPADIFESPQDAKPLFDIVLGELIAGRIGGDAVRICTYENTPSIVREGRRNYVVAVVRYAKEDSHA